MFNGYGQVPVKHALPRAAGADLPMETRRACMAAVVAKQYPTVTACYDAVRMGGAVPAADMPVTAEQQATSNTGLYVGIGIAVLVVGVGAYLITR